MIFSVAALFKPQQLPCLPGTGCSAIIHGMKSAQHQGVIAAHSGGARSDILYCAVQP
jgi:hypothetical protein